MKILRTIRRDLALLVKGRAQPDFLIVGAQKSGTTSLHTYLDRRDGFYSATRKEVHYFDREDNFQKGNNWYESHFINRGEGFYFESSPNYLTRAKVPARIYEYNPGMKIVIILRDPIARAYSAWNMYRDWSDRGRIPGVILKDQYGRKESPIYKAFFKNGSPSFSEYIDLELALIENGDQDPDDEPGVLRRGIYYPQVKRYIETFGREKVLVLGFGDLKNNPEALIDRVVAFISGKDTPSAVNARFLLEVKNKRDYPSALSADDETLLQGFYAGHNKMLFDYLGGDINW